MGFLVVGGRANIETLLAYIQNQDDPRHLKSPALANESFLNDSLAKAG